ncbi:MULTISPECIES: response regulator [unclassified Paenibacillus]|uniref:response regulator n=1 Tax=unclassified Paenibacillus TaxID=185978 RepID=UPI001E416397|nr:MULTISPECIES: response regulator [unclassified Paenibacillus]
MSNNMVSSDRRIRMLIVDDEPVICEGLRCTINWDELGVEVVGEAYDGKEALQMVQEHDVDFLLSDIRMEDMDGLHLAEQLKQQFPRVQVIMISGYEDFEYARQAIRLGVSDYLLKPVEIEELTAVVSKVVTSIRKREQEGVPQEAKLWLLDMARHGISYSKEVPTSLHGVQFRILATQLDNFYERYSTIPPVQYKEIQDRWMSMIQGYLHHSGLRSVSVFYHENLLITLAVSNIRLDRKTWDELLASAILSAEKDIVLYGGASLPYDDLADTSAYCAEATELLSYHVSEGLPVLLPEYRDSIGMNRILPDFDIAERVQQLVSALFKQDQDEVKELVASMFQFFRKEGFLLPDIVKIYEELFALLRQRLRKSGMTDLDYGHNETPNLNVYNSYTGLEALVLKEIQQLLLLIDKQGIDKSYWIIEKAKKYMNDHYQSDLKASEVASWLKITPSYFSYIFKQSTGKGFTEYMNEAKIDQAKELLATTHDKVFEIADKVGYKEYKYFVSVFKSYTGMTPKEYRGLSASKDAGK